ncbi:MAG: FAD-dependent oxidoreductase, partial [Cyanobacteria bacterium P01_H01_bin.121]
PSNCCGILELCFDAAQRGFWEDLAAIRAQQGYTLELIEQPQLAERHPYLNSERVEFAIASQQDLQVQPIPLTQALVAAAQQQGVKFIWSTAVQDLEVDGEAEPNCCAVITPQQVIETDWLILTGGLGTTALTQTLQKPVQLMPVLGQAIRVRLPQAFQGEQQIPVLTANDVHVAPLGKQPDGAHDYWLGATVEFPNACGDLPEQPNLLAQIKQDAIAFCPGLQAATVIETWSGLRPRPVNRAAPIIEWLPSYDNVLVASGHYRNGVLLAPATAHLVQQMLTERLQCS